MRLQMDHYKVREELKETPDLYTDENPRVKALPLQCKRMLNEWLGKIVTHLHKIQML